MTGICRQGAPHQAFKPLEKEAYGEWWNRVDTELGFRPSVSEEKWPSFTEPLSSVTFNIGPLFERFDELFVDAEIALAVDFANSTQRLIEPGAEMIALDWQHPGYRFYPHRATPPTQSRSWPIPVLPNGDYFVFFAPDFSFGWLTHPCEQTVCVFGGLVELMRPSFEALGLSIVRVGGEDA